MNILMAEISEEEELNWYTSVHKETTLCITLLQTKHPTINTMRDFICEEHH